MLFVCRLSSIPYYFSFLASWILTQRLARSRHPVDFIHDEEREGHEGFGYFYHKLRGLRSTSMKVFTTCTNFFLAARSAPKHNYQWRSPLSALPRDGGDIRGGSFRFFGLRLNRAGAFVVSIALSYTRTAARTCRLFHASIRLRVA